MICFPAYGIPRPATNLTVDYKGISGRAFQLLISSPIMFDGYLVTWEYFVGRPEPEACESYAAIWRTDGDFYHLVTEIHIKPELHTEKKVYTQPGNLTRVKTGDVISISTAKNGDQTTCTGNVISYRNSRAHDPPALAYDGVYYPLPEVLTTSSAVTTVDNRGVSLQVFVEGRAYSFFTMILQNCYSTFDH